MMNKASGEAMTVAAPVIISASRRTDLVQWYPQSVIDTLDLRYPPDRVHTIVVWTKFPAAVLRPPLVDVLARYRQVYLHCTITGLGGSPIEPGVPTADRALADLGPLIEFVGSPKRVAVRIDPLVRIELGGQLYDNTDPVELLAHIRETSITRVVSSFVTPYPKVTARLRRSGGSLVPISADEREMIARRMLDQGSRLGISVVGCCTKEFPSGACIDGSLLASLHPDQLSAPSQRASGQRPDCLCTTSTDIGWYASHPCLSGCLYCYANPRREQTPNPGANSECE